MLSSHQKDIKKNMNSNVLPLTLFLSTGPDLSLVLILVALPPNISSVFRQDPIRLHISNFVYLVFWRIFIGVQFTEWRNIGYILGHSRSPRRLGYFTKPFPFNTLSMYYILKTKSRLNGSIALHLLWEGHLDWMLF